LQVIHAVKIARKRAPTSQPVKLILKGNGLRFPFVAVSDGAAVSQPPYLVSRKAAPPSGAAYRDVAVAAYHCGQKEKASELLTRTEALAQQIAGPWKVTELTRIAAAWRDCTDVARAAARLAEAAVFLKTLPPLERAEEALALAEGWALAGESFEGKAQARALVTAVLAEAESAGRADTWRKPRVRALLALAELSGK